MSKVMQRELTVTTCKVAKTAIGEGGFPVLEPLDDQTIIGAVTQAQADKIIKERFANDGIVVFGLESTTSVYELPVETFFKYATIQVQLTDEEKAAKDKANAIERAGKAVTRAQELLAKAEKKVVELNKEIDGVATTIATLSGDDLKKAEDKLATIHERQVKAAKKLEERQKSLTDANKELAKVSK